MAGCGCGGSGGWQPDGMVPADNVTLDADYTYPPRVQSDQAQSGGALIAPDGAKLWDPDTGQSTEQA